LSVECRIAVFIGWHRAVKAWPINLKRSMRNRLNGLPRRSVWQVLRSSCLARSKTKMASRSMLNLKGVGSAAYVDPFPVNPTALNGALIRNIPVRTNSQQSARFPISGVRLFWGAGVGEMMPIIFLLFTARAQKPIHVPCQLT
jgi:hypothetical protein